jgi:hypothetical protein
MTETAPDLQDRVEQSLIRVFSDAFPDVTIASWSNPAPEKGKSIGIKAQSEGEDPIGTNMFNTSIEIEARNLNYAERELMRQMVGNSRSAVLTLSEYNQGKFSMPRGQPIEVLQGNRAAENENDRITTYTLSALLQPI